MADETFVRPIDLVQGDEKFTGSEVGLIHAANGSYIRLRDNGDMEVMADEGLGFIMHANTKSITFLADKIRFLTQDTEGLQWNKKAFNNKAVEFQEPTLLDIDTDEHMTLYKGVEHFLHDFSKEGDDGFQVVPELEVNDPETGELISYTQYYNKYGRAPIFREGQ